ncbi:glycosyltransferase family 4 protein [Kitasatospora phosalacinea]|uniref:glycosyltransferase family 4 protein n=1 Tax=Kitasatospora phosalacinea TaxID=2065 RepID=UPI003665AB3B
MTGRRTVAVVTPYYPPKAGGVERYAARVAAELAAAPDLEPVVITTASRGLRTTDTVEDGVRVIRLGAWLRVSNTPLSPLWPVQLRRWLHRTGAVAVNGHAPVPGLGDLAVVVAGRRATVLTYHAGSMHKGEPGSALADRLIAGYERHLLPRVMRRADRLVAVSPVSLAAGQPHAERITPGVDLALFTPGPPPSSRGRTVLYAGRLDRTSAWKGVDVLVRALPELPDGTRLVLAGGGDAAAGHLALAQRLGVADRVAATGELPAAEVAALMRGAALLVLPSRTEAESFGMVLAEAMACGTPVVGSAVGGIPDVIEDGVSGLLVPPGDTRALAAACTRVLTDGALADRLGAAGRERSERLYGWDGLMARYLSLLRSLTVDRPEPRPGRVSSRTR